MTVNSEITDYYSCGECPSEIITEKWCSVCPYYDLSTSHPSHPISYTTSTYCPYCGEVDGKITVYVCGDSKTTHYSHTCSR